jgi:RNA recognition motif-containing protein
MRIKYFRGNLFVANLPPDFEDDRLAEAFDGFGMVLSASIARDPETGKRLRYGFVDIATEKAAQAAVAGMNGQKIDGYRVDVRISDRQSVTRSSSGAPPKRMPPRLVSSRPSDESRDAPTSAGRPEAPRQEPQTGTGDSAAASSYTMPRKQPQFQVERRSLPRRPLTLVPRG